MRILITGVTGFAGGHLAEALLERPGVELVGVGRQTHWPEDLHHLADRVRLLECDLTNAKAMEAVLYRARPEQIYHLAGHAQTRCAFLDAEVVWTSNLTATHRLYEAVARWGGRPRLLYVGSGMVYGSADAAGAGHPEDAALRPTTPYAASKAAADLLSFQVTRDPGLDVVRARPFNHIGARQARGYAVADFASQVAAIEAGLRPAVLETGDLDSFRDLTDVRDVVRAYILLMERGRTGEAYNVGSGVARRMRDVVDLLLSHAREAIEVRPRADGRTRAAPAALRADVGKLRGETGWAPVWGLEESLAAILQYWRGQTLTPLANLS